jgi:hypothetical protein
MFDKIPVVGVIVVGGGNVVFGSSFLSSVISIVELFEKPSDAEKKASH